MLKKHLVIIFYFLLVFLLLIFINLKKAQREISSSVAPIYQIALVNPPLKADSSKPVEFVWKLETPDTSLTSLTTVYYDFISSPSALTGKDSPQTVGYAYSLPDYQNGQFSLPDNFSASKVFLPGQIYYRVYAKVGDQHLWSPEFRLVVK